MKDKSVECPTCGYPVAIDSWAEAEIAEKNECLCHCDMCESYATLKQVDGKLTLTDLGG